LSCPLPPLAEQSRIVTRVEELMRLCDALEAKGQLEAAQHAQLVSTLLGTLTASTTPEELADNWQRVAQHFDLLLDRPEAIDALEQTLLQLAVRGLLVPQDPTDEPASALLQKIRAEKDRLIATGQIKRDKPLPPITDEEKPFELPVGWEWVRALYGAWLQDRQTRVPAVHRHLCIWKGKDQPLGPDGVGDGPLCLVYEETSDGLDGTELSRYWLLSNEWSLPHAPCIENMVAAVAVARSLGILVTGREVLLKTLLRLETGDVLLPEAAAQIGALWHPEDLVSPMPGRDSAWRQALWQGAQGWMAQGVKG
jgi:hypothetical protein